MNWKEMASFGPTMISQMTCGFWERKEWQIALRLQPQPTPSQSTQHLIDKDDKNILLQVRDVDLIAKELQMHDTCYSNYTRVVSEREAKETENGGNFDAVKEFINENILLLNQAVSIVKIHEVYGDGNSKDTRYRHKLKQKIEECFGDDIKFLTIDKVTPQVLINAKSLNETAIVRNREVMVNLAAKYLKKDIQSYAERTPDLSWPPYITDLENQEKDMSCTVEKFLETLLCSPDHPNQERARLLVRSYSTI